MRWPAQINTWRGLALESAGALFLVLALFWCFILLLNVLFPSATPLRELIDSSWEPEAAPAHHGAEATLTEVFRDVRCRRGNSVAWGGASEGMELYSQDAVQTLDHSGATVSFGPRDRLALGSNSLVVVTRLNAKDEEGPGSYRVQVAGELSGSLSARRRLKMELAAAGHLARVAPGGARFRVLPNDDNSASLSVYSGELQLGEGGRVRVPANYGVTLREGAPVGKPLPLPLAPQLLGPQPALYRYRLLPPLVRLAWSGGEGEYHLQLSRTPGFDHPLADQRLSAPEYRTGNLELGSYFWRVSRIEQGREGPFSGTGRCDLQQQLGSPTLAVEFPPKNAPVGAYTLTGKVQPGARVFIDGTEVTAVAQGSFLHRGNLKPGVNLVRVEAVDAAGNASYASRVIYGRAGRAERPGGPTP